MSLLLGCLCRKLRAPRGASVPLAGHLQSLFWSPAAASGPCEEGLAGGRRRPLSGPQGSVAAGSECSHTSGTHLGCRRAAGERETGGSSMLKWARFSGTLGAKWAAGRIQPDLCLCDGSRGGLERDRDLRASSTADRLLGRPRGLSPPV